MIVWQRRASAAWLRKNETRLRQLADSSLAIISQPGRTRSLLEVSCDRRGLSRQLMREFGGSSRRLPNDWWRSFSPTHPPIRIGRRLEIVSSTPRDLPNRATLVIPAADAFGTGEHATTAMSLRLLEEVTRKIGAEWRLLDAGTGTGILALAARRLGARASLGLDNDPRAVINARRNARLNRITRIKFLVADILRFKTTERYEVVTVNLFSELLIAALPALRGALLPEGLLILSGILRQQSDSVLSALNLNGFRLEKKRRRGKWIALQAIRTTGDS
jgi:ribosomal protein L11 methyltransferase